ncbi:hypothetical protein IVB16_34995 [Bradyrhizobium sp. 183]|uniref:hypothetical protein n=1 Tax=unclassified Bradyrhizobium TaxID=2631580 RepID=UPI001FFE6E73|nr:MULTISPECIES: hypothetical protein [unclassified Bradyrhizobium]UPJ79782.1 hypothetical protein IVB17_34990 [Bradyrhizobium sp. 184]UPJ87577.1 hypothetical protein IVB16_34995 [Bradyrhizobium sp. 183]
MLSIDEGRSVRVCCECEGCFNVTLDSFTSQSRRWPIFLKEIASLVSNLDRTSSPESWSQGEDLVKIVDIGRIGIVDLVSDP